MNSASPSPFVGSSVPARTILYDQSRLDRYLTAVSPLRSVGCAPTFAALAVEPFLAFTPDMLPPGAEKSVTFGAKWTIGESFPLGTELLVESAIVEHFCVQEREQVDILTIGRDPGGRELTRVDVSLTWKRECPGSAAEGERKKPLANSVDVPLSKSPDWSDPLSDESVACLFADWPNADLNPHVSIVAATRYGLPRLLVSAPQLACLIAAEVFETGTTEGAELSLRFLRRVLAGQQVCITRSVGPDEGEGIALWALESGTPKLCVSGSLRGPR